MYANIVKKSHDDFVEADSGLVLYPEWSHLGASPDGLIRVYVLVKVLLK